MTAIAETFAARKRNGEMALILYATMGFPDRPSSLELIRTMADAGADLIEIGVPFSDPVADGPAIQYSSQVALDHGITLGQIIDDVAGLDLAVPLVIMSYLNPLLTYGLDRLFTGLAAVGIAGLIVPDLPVEESDDIGQGAESTGLDLILMVAPTSPKTRLAIICERSRGFVYCVSAAGTTGTKAVLDPGLNDFLASVRQATNKPIAVGFGISSPAHIRDLRGRCDAVIVGSRIVEAVRNREPVRPLIESLHFAAQGG